MFTYTLADIRSRDDLRPVYIAVRDRRAWSKSQVKSIGPNSSGSIKGYKTHDKRVL